MASSGGTSAFLLTDGPEGSDTVRKYDDCKQSDEAAVCVSCSRTDAGSTILVVLAFIFSVMSMVWSFYELCADTTDDSNNFQLLAILKKAFNLIFSICALVVFKDCYEGLSKDDEIIEVKSYEYGTGVICLIVSVLLTVTAGIISGLVLRLKNKIDRQVGAAASALAKEQEHVPHHTTAKPKDLELAFETDLFHNDLELNCDHRRHSHGFNDVHRKSGHRSGDHSGHRSGDHSGHRSGDHTSLASTGGTINVVKLH
jgi:hypothetical protein